MKRIRLGILGTSEIAFRRFLPALQNCKEFTYVGVASRALERTAPFVEAFGGRGYPSYEALLEDESIDAVYIPLPPSLHFQWAKRALECGKHVLMEKPFSTSAADTCALLALADSRGLAVHENYMFLYHSQFTWMETQLKAGEIGELRLIRAAFGFPFRGKCDFRYDPLLGGGALLDCGGYPVRLALQLLGEDASVTAASLCRGRGLEVDLFGSATLENDRRQAAQISFGMDNSYKCELELWGSEGCLLAERIFTAPPGFSPVITRKSQHGEDRVALEDDDAFLNSINAFRNLICDPSKREHNGRQIRRQSELVETIQKEGELHDPVY